MATTTATAALSMKLLIDSKAQRVLFAEASNEVVDFLFSLLALPVATAVKLVGMEAMVGSVGNLYASVDKLDSTYVQAGAAKDALLCPTVLSPAATTNSSLLRLPEKSSVQHKSFYRCAYNSVYHSSCRNYITDERGKACPHCGCSMMAGVNYLSSSVQPKSFYRCDSYNSSCRNHITDEQGKVCPNCGHYMATVVQYLPSAGSSCIVEVAAQSAAKGFVQGIVTYKVLDDLTVTPMSAISSITLLNTFAVRDLGDLEEKKVQLGYNEGLAILKASLQSKTVLTDVFLHGQAASSASTGGRA